MYNRRIFSHDYRKAHNRIYPKIGQIYLEPDNNWGRAPFYRIGYWLS